MFSGLADWVTDVIDRIGYVGVALLVALENVFPPIPSEIVLPFTGFTARDGNATLWGMVIAATIGSIAGALVLYGVAAWIGPERLDLFLIRYGKWFRLTPADVMKANGWFDRHSQKAVLLCRCVPLVRSLISIPAGFRRMDLTRFLLLTTVGSLAWNLALILAGYALRRQWHDVEPVLDVVQYVVIAVILGAIAWYVWSRFLSPAARSRAAERSAASTSDPAA